jgi:hypothetical protein
MKPRHHELEGIRMPSMSPPVAPAPIGMGPPADQTADEGRWAELITIPPDLSLPGSGQTGIEATDLP